MSVRNGVKNDRLFTCSIHPRRSGVDFGSPYLAFEALALFHSRRASTLLESAPLVRARRFAQTRDAVEKLSAAN